MISIEQSNSAFVARPPADAPRARAERDRSVVASLRGSAFFRDYQQAFETSTGLPLELHTVGEFTLVHHGARNANPLCALMAMRNKSCSACLECQRRVREQAVLQPHTLTCFAGLNESAVAVRVGDNVVAYLHVGQVLLRRPSRLQFRRTVAQLVEWGVEPDVKRLREAYFATRVMNSRQYGGILRLLTIFAQQLAMRSNQLVMTTERADPPVVERAKHFIAEHVDEELSLGQIAGAMHTSTFYFCKLFRRATGLQFLDYLARFRIEKVKSFLLNPHTRISEAAFAAGFQSLSQFNRVFKRVVGEQPRAWREKLAR